MTRSRILQCENSKKVLRRIFYFVHSFDVSFCYISKTQSLYEIERLKLGKELADKNFQIEACHLHSRHVIQIELLKQRA